MYGIVLAILRVCWVILLQIMFSIVPTHQIYLKVCIVKPDYEV